MSGTVTQQQSVFGLMSMSLFATMGCADAQGLDSYLRPCWCLRASLSLGPYQYEGLVLPPSAMVKSETQAVAEGHIWVHGATTVKDCDDVSIITLCYNWGNGRAGPNSQHSAHTHSHTLIHSHTLTNTHSHTQTHSHTLTHSYTHSTQTHSHTISHTHLSHFFFPKKRS